MKPIKVSGLTKVEVAYLDQLAMEQTNIAKRSISRNNIVKQMVRKFMRDDLSINDDKYDILNAKFDLLTEVITEGNEKTQRLINLIVHGGE